jgi:hypothetical protein
MASSSQKGAWVRKVCGDVCRANAEALVERLGQDGTEALSALLTAAHGEWTDEVMTIAVDRFERRLTSEISAVRVDVSRELSVLRVDVARDISVLRTDVARDICALRADVVAEISALRVELLKWSFLFWVGQVATMAGLLAFMLRP